MEGFEYWLGMTEYLKTEISVAAEKTRGENYVHYVSCKQQSKQDAR